jgi:hypothetical protein
LSRVLAALGVLATLTLVPASATGAEQRSPSLRIVAVTPVHVSGRAFKPFERVQLRATSGEITAQRTLRASRLGAFRATFATIEITDRCSMDLLVRAVGARGSRAAAKLPQLQCPPSLATP